MKSLPPKALGKLIGWVMFQIMVQVVIQCAALLTGGLGELLEVAEAGELGVTGVRGADFTRKALNALDEVRKIQAAARAIPNKAISKAVIAVYGTAKNHPKAGTFVKDLAKEAGHAKSNLKTLLSRSKIRYHQLTNDTRKLKSHTGNTPLHSHEPDIKNLLPTDVEVLNHINLEPLGEGNHCVSLAKEFDKYLAHPNMKPTDLRQIGSHLPIDVDQLGQDGTYFFQQASGKTIQDKQDKIVSLLKRAGNGSRGYIDLRPSGINSVGHVINVINRDGKVLFIDAQAGGEIQLEKLPPGYKISVCLSHHSNGSKTPPML